MKPVPERIAREASRRVAEASYSREVVENAVRERRPLDAEDNQERKLNYIQQKVGVRRDTAARIANYEDPNILPLTDDQKSRAESIQGTTVDFLPISFMPIGRAASRSVARVAFRDGSPQGTGFMISPRLFLTNQHVVADAVAARTFVLEFDNELDAAKRPKAITRFAIDATFFLADPEDDLDFALMAVGAKINGPRQLADFGFLPLLDTPDKHIKGVFVNVIQHPSGRPKELVIRENRIVERTANTLIYGSDTLPGSSGSPVLNDDWEVIALHHFGSPFRALVDNSGIRPNVAGNEGIRVSSIVQHLRAELPRLSSTRAALLRQALNPTFRHPSLVLSFTGREDVVVAQPPGPVNPFHPAPVVGGDGTVSVTLPLVVSFRLGGAPGVAGVVPGSPQIEPPPALSPEPAVDVPPEDAGFEGVFTPDPQYSNRRGYNRKFLGPVVEMPKLNGDQRTIAAKNLKAKQGDDPFEVKYQHFSVVTNGARRLAFFTAGNVDGASVVNINRTTGKVTRVESFDDSEGFEASERWFDDARIDPAQITSQKLYSSDDFRGFFQRGHLVKRTDPSWGTEQKARRGQADTFHFTNCAPQHKGFNPVKSRWAGVEDWITDGSDDDDLRVTVFTGPVFRDDDPTFDTIQVPKEFWKVVVRVEEDELLATAILADQSDLLEQQEAFRESAGAEDLPDFPDKLPDEYQVTIAEIEELTGLDFGPLRDHDTFAGGSEGLASRRKLESFQDISIDRPSAPAAKKAPAKKAARRTASKKKAPRRRR